MPSNVNPLVPTEGVATTASVRANFMHIKTEIESLQNDVAYEVVLRDAADAQTLGAANNFSTDALTSYSTEVNGVLSNLNTAIGAEATARINGDTAEQAARIDADAATYIAYVAAIAAEALIREDADAAEVDARSLAISSEAADRVAADDSLSDRLNTLEETDQWHEIGETGEPAFHGTWSNYLNGWPKAAFKKFPDQSIRFRGLIKCTSYTMWDVIFVLPSTHMPTQGNQSFACGSIGSYAEVVVAYSGYVMILAGNAAYIDLSGISVVHD